jgi:hypothetical protein
VEEIKFPGKKHPKEKHDEKGQHKGRYDRTVFGGVTRVNEHLSEISNAKVAPSQSSGSRRQRRTDS